MSVSKVEGKWRMRPNINLRSPRTCTPTHVCPPNTCKSMHPHVHAHHTYTQKRKLYVADKSLPKIFSIHILACPEFVCQGGTELASFLNKINEEQIKKPRAICSVAKGDGTGGEKNPHLPQDP